MRKIILFLLLVVLYACKTSPNKTAHQHTKPKNIPIDSTVIVGKLKNGLTYYIKQNPKPEEKVELRLVVKAGSILENEKQLGLAHFMEHMNFNGSKNFKKNELVDYLQSIGVKFGAHLNAYTSFDETVYILPIPVDDEEKLEKGFQIIEDWAFNASLTEEEIDKERGVVLEEYRIGLGAGKRMLQKYLPKLMFQSRYAERLPIGKKEVLENFKYEELRDFYKSWYRPELMSVIAVGDVDEKIIEQKIIDHFSSYTNPVDSKERIEYTSPNHNETLISICTDKEATRATVQLYYKDTLPSQKVVFEKDYRNSITNHLFTAMLNSRLDDLRNNETPPFIYAGTGYNSLWDKSKKAFQAYALTSEEGQLEALKTILTENERILQFGFTENELARAKKDLISSLEKINAEKSKTKSGIYASEYIQNFLNKEPIPGIEWEFNTTAKLLTEINLKECNALITNKIHNNNLVIILTGPEKENLKPVTEQQILHLLKEVKNESIEAYQDNLSDIRLMKDIIPTPGKIINSKTDALTNATTITLSNGAKVTYKQTEFKNDEILFSAFSYGGSSLYHNDEYLKTVLANSVLTEAGINGYSKNDLKKVLTGKQAFVYPYISDIEEGFRGSSSTKDLETLFQLTHLYFTKLNYDETAYNSYKNKAIPYYENALSEPKTFFNKSLNEYLNQNNKRFIGFPNQEKYNNTDFKLAYQKYQERFANAGDFHFYFVGNFNENTLKEYAEKYFASLPSSNNKEQFVNNTPTPVTGKNKKVIHKGTEPKSLVKIIYQGIANEYEKEDAYYLKSLGELLTIKLVENLRENESGVYGVGAKGNFSFLPEKEYSFSISFPCGPENVDKLIEKAYHELELIQKNGATEKDLMKIKETQLLENKEALKENQYWLGLLKKIDFYENSANEYLNQRDRIEKLNSDNLKQIANKYLIKNRIVAILKPEE